MNTRVEFWSAVDEELDARREPLASDAVRAWLLEHPEDAVELGDLRAALGAVERADNPLRAPRRSRILPLASAAALALLALGAWLAVPSRSAVEELESHPVVARPELGSVQAWSLVSSSETAEGTRTVRASEGRIEIESDYHTQQGALAQACVLVTQEESWSPR